MDASEIEPYRGRLEIADEQEMKVDGCITARLKVGAIDKDLDMQPVPKLKAEMQMMDEVSEHVGVNYSEIPDSRFEAQPVDDFLFPW